MRQLQTKLSYQLSMAKLRCSMHRTQLQLYGISAHHTKTEQIKLQANKRLNGIRKGDTAWSCFETVNKEEIVFCAECEHFICSPCLSFVHFPEHFATHILFWCSSAPSLYSQLRTHFNHLITLVSNFSLCHCLIEWNGWFRNNCPHLFSPYSPYKQYYALY